MTYGGVSLFVAFFVLAPMGLALFRRAMFRGAYLPAAIALGIDLHDVRTARYTPAIQTRSLCLFSEQPLSQRQGWGSLQLS